MRNIVEQLWYNDYSPSDAVPDTDAYPSRWSGRALFTKAPPGLSPERADNAVAVIVGAAPPHRLRTICGTAFFS